MCLLFRLNVTDWSVLCILCPSLISHSFSTDWAPWDKADILQQYAAMQCYAVIEDKWMLQSEDDAGVMERWWWWHDCWMIGCGENGMVGLSPSVLWSHVWQCAGYSISWQWSPTLTASNWILQMCKDYTIVWFLDNMRQDTQVSTFTWSDFWTVLCCHWPLLRLAVDCRISCWVAVYCINSYYWIFTLNISPLHSLEEVPHPSTHALSTHFVYLWLVIVLMYVYVHTKIVMSSLSTLLLYLAPLMAAVCTHASVLVWCKQYTTCTQDIICLHKGFPISQGVWVSSATPDIIFRYPHKISLNSWQAAVEKCLN